MLFHPRDDGSDILLHLRVGGASELERDSRRGCPVVARHVERRGESAASPSEGARTHVFEVAPMLAHAFLLILKLELAQDRAPYQREHDDERPREHGFARVVVAFVVLRLRRVGFGRPSPLAGHRPEPLPAVVLAREEACVFVSRTIGQKRACSSSGPH